MLVRRQHPGQRSIALDDLEQRLFLSEEVLVGAGHEMKADVSEQAGTLHLLQRHRQRGPLPLEALLDGDEALGRADGEGGDGGTLEQLVGVGPQQRPVFERAGLALGRVDGQVFGRAGCGAHAGPLPPGGKPRPAPAPQSRLVDLGDSALGPEVQGSGDPLAAAPLAVVVERGDGQRWEQETLGGVADGHSAAGLSSGRGG